MSNENENTSPLVQAAVDALNNKSNFEFGASKMASGSIRETQGTSSAPKVIAEESAEQISELAPPGNLPVPAAPAAGGSSGSNYRGPLGAGGARRPRGPINRAAATTVASRGSAAKAALKTAGKAATPLVAGYGAYQGYNFDPNAPTSRRLRNAAQQAAQYTVDLPRTGAALVGLGALGAAKLGVPGAENFAGQAFEWGEKKGWIPNLEKTTSGRNTRGVQSRIDADRARDARRNVRGVQSRIDADKARDAAAAAAVAAAKPAGPMSDEQRYGKTGAEIIKLGGMEAYKNRPKDAKGNIEYLNKLRSDQRAAQISADVTARAKQTPLTAAEPQMIAPDMSSLQQIQPAVTLKKPGVGIFRSASTGEKTGLRKAIPNELAAIFSPRSRAEQKQKKIDSLQPITITAKRITPAPAKKVSGPIEEQSDANYDMINRDALPVPSYRNIRGVQDRINADARRDRNKKKDSGGLIGPAVMVRDPRNPGNQISWHEAQRIKQSGGVKKPIPDIIGIKKPMPLPPAGGDVSIMPVPSPGMGGGLKKGPFRPGMGGGMKKASYVPAGTMGEAVNLNESAMLLEQYINEYGPELVYEQLNEVLIEQHGEESVAEFMIETIVQDFNQRELTNEQFALLREESDAFVANMESLTEEQLCDYIESLDEEQLVYAIQLSSLNEGLFKKIKKGLKKVGKALKKVAKVALPIAAGFLLPGIGSAIAGKLGTTALGTAVKGIGSRIASSGIGKAVAGLGKNIVGKTLVGAVKQGVTQGAMSALQGDKFGQGFKQGVVGGVAGGIGGALGGKVAQLTGSQNIGDIAGSAASGALQGKALGYGATAGARYGATGAIQDKVFGNIEKRLAAADAEDSEEEKQRKLAQNRTASSTQAMAAESVKLDPVGREDADVNNDGKQDKTDVYLARKREKIGNAIAKRLGKK